MPPNEITIRYEKGEMIIRLENFFNPPSIMRTRNRRWIEKIHLRL